MIITDDDRERQYRVTKNQCQGNRGREAMFLFTGPTGVGRDGQVLGVHPSQACADIRHAQCAGANRMTND